MEDPRNAEIRAMEGKKETVYPNLKTALLCTTAITQNYMVAK